MFVNFVLFCEEGNVDCEIKQIDNAEWRPPSSGGEGEWKNETKTSQG